MMIPNIWKIENVPNHQPIIELYRFIKYVPETIYISRRQNQLLMLRKYIRDYSW